MAQANTHPLASIDHVTNEFRQKFILPKVYAIPDPSPEMYDKIVGIGTNVAAIANEIPSYLWDAYMEYRINSVTMVLHTVDDQLKTSANSSGKYGVYIAPWNRPIDEGTNQVVKCRANLLPNCVWKVFDTSGFGMSAWTDDEDKVAASETADNQVGLGGALVCHQPLPQYQIEATNDNGQSYGEIMRNQFIPTYAHQGRDKTIWSLFLLRVRSIKRTTYSKQVTLYYNFILDISWRGTRLRSTAFGIPPLVSDAALCQRSADTFEDLKEQARTYPVLWDISKRTHSNRKRPLACIRGFDKKSNGELLESSVQGSESKRQAMDQTIEDGESKILSRCTEQIHVVYQENGSTQL